jgi:hypothetical protein
MRAHHLIAIAIAFAAGFGVNQFLFSPSTARANVDAIKGSSIDVSKLPVHAGLPLQKMHDMTFVLSDSD